MIQFAASFAIAERTLIMPIYSLNGLNFWLSENKMFHCIYCVACLAIHPEVPLLNRLEDNLVSWNDLSVEKGGLFGPASQHFILVTLLS